ncbi:MAG: DNA replication and repair protein RecF [Saprospiraceae bacterium]|nr:DNA replication and repair protein RecF [Saprospiraceae bacterium]
MKIKSLSIYQYKNYESEKIRLHPVLNAFTGLNGMGKTNLLDAVYYLCLGKSYFSATDKLNVMQEKEAFRLEGNFNNETGDHKVVIKVQLNNGKDIELSGKKTTRISDHVGTFPCVMIAPIDIQLMLEGSEERRNFFNNTIVQYDKSYLEDLLVYNKLLKQRNALLKSMQEQKRFDPILLESVSRGMIAPSQNIFTKRKELESKIKAVFSEIYADISGKRENCEIEYSSQLAENGLAVLMEKHIDKDRILCRTTQGIHKDDLTFSMNGYPLKSYASQGQLKSFVLALKLAQYKILETVTGTKPLLLLDDIFDKLDKERVTHLLSLVTHPYFGQVFLTDTQPDRIRDILLELNKEHAIFVVQSGSVISDSTEQKILPS